MIRTVGFIVAAFQIFGWCIVYQTGNYVPWGNIAITITIMNLAFYILYLGGAFSDLNQLGDDKPFSVAKIKLAKKTIRATLPRTNTILNLCIGLIVAGLLSANGYTKWAAVYASVTALATSATYAAIVQSKKILDEKPENQ